jgi:hypothetical protein
MKKSVLTLLGASLLSTALYAQTKIKDGSVVGSSPAPSPNAILELESNSRGLLLPRMSTSQMNAISSPTEGLVIYNITEGCVFTYNNAQWNSLCSTTDFCGVVLVGDGDDDTDAFDNPNNSGGIFSPNDPRNTCALYVTENGQTWTWNGSSYVTKPVKVEPWWNKATGTESESVTDHIYHLGSVNIGNGSAAGRFSLTVGNGNVTNAQNSFVSGYKNQLTSGAYRSGVWGGENTVRSATTGVWGRSNNTYENAHRSAVWGYENSLWGTQSAIWGNGNRIFSDASNSAAWGYQNTVTNAAGSSAAWGSTNTIASEHGGIWGYLNTVNGNRSAGWGNENTIQSDATNSAVWGFKNTVYNASGSAAAWGTGNSLSSQYGAVWGNGNTINGNSSGGWGNSNSINSSAVNSAVWGFENTIGQHGLRSAAFGNGNTVNGNNSLAFGSGNNVFAEHHNSLAMGSGCNTTSSNQLAGRFSGGVRFLTVTSGNASPGTGAQLSNGATSWSATSDRRAKSNILPIPYGLKSVMALKPSVYNYKGNSYTSLGLIAQDVLEVVPEVVDKTEYDKNSNEYMGIRYTELVPVLVKAIQEQQAIIEQQTKEIGALKDEVKNWSEATSSIQDLIRQVEQLRERQGLSQRISGNISK